MYIRPKLVFIFNIYEFNKRWNMLDYFGSVNTKTRKISRLDLVHSKGIIKGFMT